MFLLLWGLNIQASISYDNSFSRSAHALILLELTVRNFFLLGPFLRQPLLERKTYTAAVRLTVLR